MAGASGGREMVEAGSYAARVMERAEALGRISEEEGRLTRRFGTSALLQAREVVAGWMREAGMTVRVDSMGSVIGRYEPQGEEAGEAKTLLFGSHIDTVRDAGRYDGPLGVLVAIACVERMRDGGMMLPFAVEVPAFADEEGVRFGAAYLGSRALTGSLDRTLLDLRDDDGVTMAEAIRAGGGDPERVPAEGRDGGNLLGYCEVHIEQGPVLESEGLPVGVVTAIAGQTRVNITLRGEAGHAGTVPMGMRRDALCAAAEFVLEVEALGRRVEGLVGTVGQMDVQPGAGNVIPGLVKLSLDVRHQEDSVWREAVGELRQRLEDICAAREIMLQWQVIMDNAAVPCSAGLADRLAEAVKAAGYPVRRLPSGAGHDGVIMAAICPVAMLFVRCKGGISHNPAESVEVGDVAAAIAVMGRFLEGLGVSDAQTVA